MADQQLQTDPQIQMEAEKTFSGFVALMKWGTIVSVALVALVVLMIA